MSADCETKWISKHPSDNSTDNAAFRYSYNQTKCAAYLRSNRTAFGGAIRATIVLAIVATLWIPYFPSYKPA